MLVPAYEKRFRRSAAYIRRMRPGIEQLRELTLFADLDEDQLSAINEVADLARIGPQEVLFRQGDRLSELTVLTAGFVAETVVTRATETVMGVISAPHPIALSATVLGMPSTTGARTITSVRLILVPTGTIRDLLLTKHTFCRGFLDQALLALHSLSDDIVRLKLCSAARRLAMFLLELVSDPNEKPARFVLPFEKRFLAGKIGCSHENLSRAFAALRPLGVETQRGVVVVQDLARLREFAGIGLPIQA